MSASPKHFFKSYHAFHSVNCAVFSLFSRNILPRGKVLGSFIYSEALVRIDRLLSEPVCDLMRRLCRRF